MWFTSRMHRRGTGRRLERATRFVPRLEALEDRSVPSTLTVLNNQDSGAGSLRDALGRARDGDTIVFAPGLNGQTIALTSDELAVKNSVDIEGPWASLLAVSGNDTNRVFDINAGLTVRIAGLTITHGRAAHDTGVGGGIQNLGSTVTVANAVFSSNIAVGGTSDAWGGAISNIPGDAVLTVTDSTFVGNQADGRVRNNGSMIAPGIVVG